MILKKGRLRKRRKFLLKRTDSEFYKNLKTLFVVKLMNKVSEKVYS